MMSMLLHLELPPRLQAIADLVPQGTRLADIGTDHGYLPIWLLKEGRILSAVAADIGNKPLQRAVKSAGYFGVTMSFRQCDGLAEIRPEEVDTIAIAGMGGETIIHILQEAEWTKTGKTLLLQPMSKPELLRRWLAENGYVILQERLVLDRKVIYPILVCTGGVMEIPDDGQACYGYSGNQDPLFRPYLNQWIERTRRALTGLEKGAGIALQPRQQYMLQLLKKFEEKGEEQV